VSEPGRILIVSGPSGVGKSSVCERLLAAGNLEISVSATTRAPRGDEQEGVAYHFLSVAEFQRRIEAGEFLEWAQVHGSTYYGTLAAPVEEALKAGRHVLLDIDVQGAEILRSKGLGVTSLLLMPPSLEELRRRLEGRGDTDADDIERRLQHAECELAEAHKYDLALVNEGLDRTVATVRAYLGLGAE
jgi:guanylate kinase